MFTPIIAYLSHCGIAALQADGNADIYDIVKRRHAVIEPRRATALRTYSTLLSPGIVKACYCDSRPVHLSVCAPVRHNRESRIHCSRYRNTFHTVRTIQRCFSYLSPNFAVPSLRVLPMGAARHGQGGGALAPWKCANRYLQPQSGISNCICRRPK